PRPEATKTGRIAFPSIHQAATTVTRIITSKIIPVTLEFMDNACIRCVEDHLSMGLPVDAEALLIIEVDGRKEQVEAEVLKIKEICEREGATEIKIAENEEERDKLWQARRAVSPAIVKPYRIKMNEDIVVPRSKVPEIIKDIQKLADKYQIEIINFGHAGDGNIHVNILADKRDMSQLDRAPALIKEIFDATLKLGGSISGEHGIGLTKAPYIGMELGDQGIEIMKRIKKAFDPNNILNPGKIFP
ncbi:glycolate oxidase subunit GlcD, partial [bacterium]|nr:glycolate oxidase subunit GlcD [bacterium]